VEWEWVAWEVPVDSLLVEQLEDLVQSELLEELAVASVEVCLELVASNSVWREVLVLLVLPLLIP
jgi:hypothetical protein